MLCIALDPRLISLAGVSKAGGNLDVLYHHYNLSNPPHSATHSHKDVELPHYEVLQQGSLCVYAVFVTSFPRVHHAFRLH